MITKICSRCRYPFTTTNNRTRICDKCKQTEIKQKEYNKSEEGRREIKEKISESVKVAMNNRTIRETCSISAKKAWEDEEYRAKVIAALKKPRKSAPKKKDKVIIKNVEQNSIVFNVEGINNAKLKLSELGIGSKKFTKLRKGEIVENLQMIVIDRNKRI